TGCQTSLDGERPSEGGETPLSLTTPVKPWESALASGSLNGTGGLNCAVRCSPDDFLTARLPHGKGLVHASISTVGVGFRARLVLRDVGIGRPVRLADV